MRKRFTRRALSVGILSGLVGAALLVGGPSSAATRGLVAEVKDATGNAVAKVRVTRTDDGKTRVRIVASGLTAGFHGFHVHTTGQCDPAAQDSAGTPVPFLSAGGHYNPAATTHGAHSGDMPPLYAAADGRALLVFKTDLFRPGQLMDDDGSAVVIHAGPDNLAHIPATTPTGDRYHSHLDDVLGADGATKATGDAGSRFACGVLQRATS